MSNEFVLNTDDIDKGILHVKHDGEITDIEINDDIQKEIDNFIKGEEPKPAFSLRALGKLDDNNMMEQ